MKKISVLLFGLLLILGMRSFAQNDGGVSIGKGSNPANQKSILELVSKTKGLLIPRMTDTERNAIFSGADQAAKGLMVFDDTRNAFYFWDGSAWKAIASGNVMTVSGTPSTPGTSGELVLDTQNSLLYIYDGGKWLKVGAGNTNTGLASDVKVIPNTTVGMSSVNVQDALLELQDEIKTASGGGMNSVVHDAALSGNGTDGIPLTIAPGGISGSHLKDAAVTAAKISGGGNNKVLTTDGAGTTVWADKSSLGGSGGSSSSVITDKTLTGDGTASLPLGLRDGMVTASKISGGGSDKILTTDATGTAVWIDKSALGGSGGTSSSVITDKTLTGDGTALSRLGLATDAVTSDKIGFGAVTAAKIDDDAVTSSKIHDFAITTSKIEDGAVSTTKLAFGAATSEKIGYRAITSEKIEEEAVTSSKILDGTIQAKDLGDMNAQDGYILQWKGGYGWLALPGSLGTGGGITKITPGTGLTGGGSVGDVTLGLADGGVSTSKIADGAIQASKLGQMGATTSGQVLQWDGSVWKPATVSGGTGSGTNLSAATTGTSMTINSSTGTSTAVIPIGSTTSAGLMTATDKVKLDAITGTNTGDQDLSLYALKANVLERTNTGAFTPTGAYQPATKKYVDDKVAFAGGGDMMTTTYDTDGISEQLVGLTATQTLTNKTLTSPQITSPVGITKSDVGLSAVQNTSDMAKPVSTATQLALDGKVDKNANILAGTATKITYDSKGLVTGGVAATTADITSVTDKRYVTEAQLALIGNTSGTNTGDETAAGIRTKLGITTLTGSNTGDQTASTVSVTPTSTLTSLTVQAALIELEGEIIAAASGGLTSVLTDATLSGNGNTTALSIATSGVTTAKIADKAVTLTKMADLAPKSLIGNSTTAAARPEAITVGSGLTLNGGVLSAGGTAGATGGDVAIAGQTYLTLSGQTLTAGAVDLSGAHATGILAAPRFPALTGDVTTTAGSLTTTIGAGKVTNAMLASGIDAAKLTVGVLPLSSIPTSLTGITSLNGLVLTPLTTGFSISGGTSSKTLTLADNASVSGTNTGDQTITLTGNVTGSGTGTFATTIADDAITSAKIANGTITAVDLNQMSASSGQVLQWNGSSWIPSTVTAGGDADSDPSNEIELPVYSAVGNEGKILAVKSNRSAVEWVTPNSGTVTSVGLSLPSIFTVSNSPVTGSGTLSAAFASQAAATVLAAPAGGGVPAFRAIVASDIPVLNQNTTGSAATAATVTAAAQPAITSLGTLSGLTVSGTISGSISGNAATATTATTASNIAGGAAGDLFYQSAAGTTAKLPKGLAGEVLTMNPGATSPIWSTPAVGGGTVSSVGLSLPSIFTVSNSPVTGSGTLSAAFASQAAATVLAAPAGGGVPAFRAIIASDIPVLNQNTTGTAATVTAAAQPAITSLGTLSGLTVSSTINGSISGNAATATMASNIDGGVAGDLFYQSAVGTTAKLAKGTAGQVLTMNPGATSPIWSTPAGGGDMLLGTVQSVTGLKTFDNLKLSMKGTGTGITTFSTANTTASDYTLTLPAASGTVALSTSPLNQFGATTSAQLAGVISDESGSGSLVFATSPTLVTPALGAATATSVTATGNLSGSQLTSTIATGTAPFIVTSTTPVTNLSIGGTAAKATNIDGGVAGDLFYQSAVGTTAKLAKGTAGQVLTMNPGATSPIWSTPAGGGDMLLGTAQSVTGLKTFDNSKLSMKGTGTGVTTFSTANTTASNYTLTLPAATGTVALSSSPLSQFAATTSAELAGVISNETGTGSLVFATSPTLVTPALGAATATSITATGNLSGSQLTSTIATGTAPFSVNSTTPVTNLSIGGNAATATTATKATNIDGGDAGQVLYQSAAGTTAKTAAGTLGQVLTSNGTGAPTWTTPSGGGSNPPMSYTSSAANGVIQAGSGTTATIPAVTPTAGTNLAGLMIPADKTKLDNLPTVTNTPAAGQVLMATSTTSATWQAPTGGGGGGGSTIYKAINQAGTADVATVLVKGSGPKIKFWIETAAINIFHIIIPDGAVVDYIRIYTTRTDMTLKTGFYYCYVDVTDESGNTNNDYLDALMPVFSYVILNRLNATEAPWSTTTVPLAGTFVENCSAGTLHTNIALGTAEIPDVSDGGTYIILSY